MGDDELYAAFWSRVIPTGFCWEWTGSRTWHGYGEFSYARSRKRAHRAAYTMLIGPIPRGLVLDHLCRNRVCVNPDHLEPVTIAENLRRGFGHGSETHCPQGHEYTPENVYQDGSSRKCRTCVLARMQRYYRERVAA
jgi:hypothetical protein